MGDNRIPVHSEIVKFRWMDGDFGEWGCDKQGNLYMYVHAGGLGWVKYEEIGVRVFSLEEALKVLAGAAELFE